MPASKSKQIKISAYVIFPLQKIERYLTKPRLYYSKVSRRIFALHATDENGGLRLKKQSQYNGISVFKVHSKTIFSSRGTAKIVCVNMFPCCHCAISLISESIITSTTRSNLNANLLQLLYICIYAHVVRLHVLPCLVFWGLFFFSCCALDVDQCFNALP